MKIRLLIVGGKHIWSIENFYYKYLLKLDVEVKLFPAQSLFFDYYQKNIANKIMHRVGLSAFNYKIQKQFKKQVESYKPNIIWVFKGMEISPSSLKWAKAKGIKLVAYNPDNPFIFSSRGSGNKNVRNSIPLYDLHLTYNNEVKKRIEEVYHLPVHILPFGYEFDDNELINYKKEEEISKICFLGNPDTFRASFILQLADSGLPIDVYGYNWDKFVSHSIITIYPVVKSDEIWKILIKYRVQLNIMRPHNLNSHNMRSFEIAGVGGIQLAPDTIEHKQYFTEGKEIFLYKGIADCIKKAVYLLELDKEEANKIRLAAKRKSAQSGYSYFERAKQIVNYFTPLINDGTFI